MEQKIHTYWILCLGFKLESRATNTIFPLFPFEEFTSYTTVFNQPQIVHGVYTLHKNESPFLGT